MPPECTGLRRGRTPRARSGRLQQRRSAGRSAVSRWSSNAPRYFGFFSIPKRVPASFRIRFDTDLGDGRHGVSQLQTKYRGRIHRRSRSGQPAKQAPGPNAERRCQQGNENEPRIGRETGTFLQGAPQMHDGEHAKEDAGRHHISLHGIASKILSGSHLPGTPRRTLQENKSNWC
jgi:hypothetical protein